MNRYLIAILILLISSVSLADDYRNYMNKGEDSYDKESFSEAIENYRQAEVLEPEDPKASFNSGASMFKSGDYVKAAEKFLQTTSLTEGKFQSEAYYNLGNSLLESQDYKNALDAYKNSLMLDPANEDAKFNYELAKKRMEEQQQQQQQQQQQNQDQQDKQENQDQQENQQQQQDQNQQQNKDEQQQQEQQQQQQQEQEQQEQQEQQQKPEPQKGEMSEDEAKALLDAFKQDEKDVQKELKKYKVPRQSRRDW